MKDFIASEKFLIGSNGQVGGVAPNAVNDIIKWDGTKWVAGVNPGGNGGGGSAVAAPFTTSLYSGSTTYSVVFPEPFDITPSIATDLEITGDGPIIPYTISNLTTNGYDVIFAKEIPNNNYKIHTVFGGGGGGTGGGDSTLSGESLQEIDRQITANAVDIFVYNTQQDSDGGTWRSRTSHTSWYNEALNTATRGSRREFPAVAVIVAETDKVTIYDGDDPDLPMWMVFNPATTNNYRVFLGYNTSPNVSSVTALNGQLSIGSQSTLNVVRFLHDNDFRTGSTASWYTSQNVEQRNDEYASTETEVNLKLINSAINDVAMTVLPNAPIDSETGLPVPTIAVATDGGASVIKHDGSVVNLLTPYAGFENVTKISFSSDGRLHFNMYDEIRPGRYFMLTDIPDKDETLQMSFEPDGDSFNKLYILDPGAQSYYSAGNIRETTTITKALNDNFAEKIQVLSDSRNVFGSSGGLTFLDYNKNIIPSINESAEGMVCYATSSYNTGWMPGDIKLATLSDTKNETVGVDETTELIVDGSGNWVGDFDVAADVSEWTGSGGTIDGSLGYVRITQTTNSTAYLTIPINTVVGKKYKISADIRTSVADTVNTGAAFYIGETAYQNDVALRRPMVSEGSFSSFSLEFVATTSVTHITLASWAQSGDHVEFDNVSVKQTGELVTNGTFDNGIEGWIDQSSGTQSVDSTNVSAGELTLTRLNSDVEQVSQLLNLVEGKRYVLSFDVTASINDKGEIWVGTDLPLDNQVLEDGGQTAKSALGTGNILGVGSYLYTFTAGSTNYLSMRVGGNDTISWDNISVRLAEEDRSANDKGLQVFGEIDKTPVATGADLVAYSGFSSGNYLMQPYNPDLDFGTGDFCVMGWAKTTSDANQKIFTRDLNLTNRFQVYINNGGVSVFTEEDDQFSYLEGSTDVNNGSWFNFFCIRRSGVLEVYVNGKQETAQASGNHETARNLNFGQIPSYAGIHIHNSANYFEGSIALLRISATAPTAEQVAKIYRDEKALFQDGAQATLYGTSDAVTALAYDNSENLLHVGTASGRSVFNGLKRVDNTTTAVTTAVSANEGLVIEQ